MTDSLQRYYVVQDHDTLRVLSDPIRMQILGLLISHERTGKQIANHMKMSASKVHYQMPQLGKTFVECHFFLRSVRL